MQNIVGFHLVITYVEHDKIRGRVLTLLFFQLSHEILMASLLLSRIFTSARIPAAFFSQAPFTKRSICK